MRLASAAREIPEPRMSQLPTNPILDRSGTPVLTGEYQQDSPSMLLRATRPHSPLDASPVISTPFFHSEGLLDELEQVTIANQYDVVVSQRPPELRTVHNIVIALPPR